MLSGIAVLIQAGCCLFAPKVVYANEAVCGALNITQFGPYDYRTQRAQYKVVVDHHFTPDIEALLLRSNGAPPGGDLSYTLRSIPNHHRALVAVTRYGQRWKDKDLQFSVECYFERAVRFRPDDTVVRGLYASFLVSKNRRDEAVTQLDAAVNHAGENPLSHYNIGLIYAEVGQFEKALAQAQRAMMLGAPGGELEKQLRRAGKWPDSIMPEAPR